MDRQILNFTANEQMLTVDEPIRISTNKVNYIEAHFALGTNWSGYDSVRAVWFNDYQTISTVLDSQGVCRVPFEVMKRKGQVKVDLVGSISENDVLTDRLTSYPVVAVVVDCVAPITGAETSPITPSQFEQFVANVRADADRAEAGAEAAETSASEASASATASAQSATASANSASQAQTYAQNAQNYAVSAETAKDDAIDAKEDAESAKADAESARDQILGMRATANTLAEGSDATASYSNGLLTLGIPRGNAGAKGDKGDKGDTGATPNLSIGTVETLPPTGTSEVTITGTAENPVLNFKLVKGDTGEVTMAQLAQLLPTDTASGEIASWTDGTDVFPAVSVLTTIEPIQSLNGYDKPWSGGDGKNKLYNDSTTATSNGITFTKNADGTVTANGTATDNATFIFPINPLNDGASYILNGCPSGGGLSTWEIMIIRPDAPAVIAHDYGSGTTFTYDSTTHGRIQLVIRSGQTVNNLVFKPMIRLSSETDNTFAPYSNICPISGHTECVTEVCGTNVWDEEWKVGDISGTTGNNVSSSTNIRSKNYIPAVNGATYYFQMGTNVSDNIRMRFYDADKNFIGTSPQGGTYVYPRTTFTPPQNCCYMRFALNDSYGTTYKNDISINYPSTDHEYHAYNGNTYTTSLGRTVYGGTLDVVSGVLTVDRISVDLSSLSWSTRKTGELNKVFSSTLPSQYMPRLSSVLGWLSDRYVEQPSTNAAVLIPNVDTMDVGVYSYTSSVVTDIVYMLLPKDQSPSGQLVYELATPQTYQLSAQEVELLLGTNNLWTDCGSVNVTYKADTYLWVEKQLGQ